MDKSFARKYSDAFLGITKLAARMGLPGSEVAKGVIEVAASVTAASVTAKATALENILASDTDGEKALDAFVKVAQKRDEYPILIIDEANLAFSVKDANGQYKNKPVLDHLVNLTKQQGDMMTLLTSSEHGYPFRLDEMGFNLADLTNVIYVGEIPPKEMRELFVSRLGMGDRLADGFLSAFGGHIFTAE